MGWHRPFRRIGFLHAVPSALDVDSGSDARKTGLARSTHGAKPHTIGRRIWIATAVFLLVPTGVSAWAIQKGLHHDLYAAIFLPVVAHRAAGDAATPEEIAARLEQFVYSNVRSVSQMPETNHDPQAVLLR